MNHTNTMGIKVGINGELYKVLYVELIVTRVEWTGRVLGFRVRVRVRIRIMG